MHLYFIYNVIHIYIYCPMPMIHFPSFCIMGTSPEQLQGAKMRLEYQARAVEHVWYLKMVSVPQVWTVSIGTLLFSTFFSSNHFWGTLCWNNTHHLWSCSFLLGSACCILKQHLKCPHRTIHLFTANRRMTFDEIISFLQRIFFTLPLLWEHWTQNEELVALNCLSFEPWLLGFGAMPLFITDWKAWSTKDVVAGAERNGGFGSMWAKK